MYKRVDAKSLEITKPGFFLVKVDSTTAREWLKLNINNRRLRKSLIEYLKRSIKTGEWREDNPAPIVFSDAGRLIDGQHRLNAVADLDLDSNSAVWLRVETGAKDTVREYIDTGISRTLEDRVQLDLDPVFNKFASQIITSELSIVQGKHSKYGKVTPDDAREFFELHEKSIKQVFERHKRERSTGQVSVSLAAMQYFEKDEEKADEFYTDLFVAAGHVQQSQMLRDFLLRTENGRGGLVFRREIFHKAIGCMKAHMEGRHVTKVTRASNW